MIRLRFCLLLVTLAAVGCTTATAKRPAEPPTVAAATPSTAPPLPANELTAPLLYDLLAAEIAAQRGDFGLASANYLAAAWETRDPRIAKRAVRLAVSAGKQAKALDASELWVELTPDDPEARQVLSALLIRSGRAEEALPHLEAFLDAAGDESSGFDAVVALLSRESDKGLALSLFDRLVQKRAADPNARFAHAQLAFMVGKPAVAAADLVPLLKRKPKWVKALVLKATIEQDQGKRDEALRTYKAAVKAAPKDASLRVNYARMLAEAERFDEARREFEVLQRQHPENSAITYALGLLAMEMGELKRAESHFRHLLKGGQRKDEAAFALGQIAESRQKWDEALRWYEAVAEGSNALDAKLRAASIIKRRDGLAAARRFLRALGKAVAHPEDKSRVVLAEAELLRKSAQYKDAMKVLDAGLKAEPDGAALLYAHAMIAERLNKLDVLERDLRKILAADPENTQALNALGYTLADRTKRHKEAYDLIRRALDQRPDDLAINDSMGWVLFRMGRYPEAEKYLKKAAGALKDPEVAAHLGELYWAMGRKEEARRVWEQAPDSPLIKTVIKRLTQ